MKSKGKPTSKPAVVQCPIHVYEITYNISMSLSKRDLGACVLVSHAWAHSFVPFLWQSITTKLLPTSNPLLKQSLRHHGAHIRNLILDCSGMARANEPRSLVYDNIWICSLTRLHIQTGTIFERPVLSILTRNRETLRELRYESNKLEWLRGQALPELPKLQVLELGNWRLTKDRFRKLLKAKFPKLESVGLRDVKILPDGTVVPAKGCSEIETAENLYISWWNNSMSYARFRRLRRLAVVIRNANMSANTRVAVRSLQSSSQPLSDDEKHVKGIKHYLAGAKIYPVLDLFPRLQSISFRPEQQPSMFRHGFRTSEKEALSQMITSTCPLLETLSIETHAPLPELWTTILGSVSRLVHFSMGNNTGCDVSVVREVLWSHFAILETVQVDNLKTAPASVLRFLEKCPRLRRWTCSEAVKVSACDLVESLRRGWACCGIMEEMQWPEGMAGFGKRDIRGLLTEQQQQMLIDDDDDDEVYQAKDAASPEGIVMQEVLALLSETLRSMGQLQYISFGTHKYRMK
ncbi:hypothetical protein EDD21DRAFT_355673 [Dissophora ornata]|nr:hypothetical protein BGZ58_006357 [Dissophora ornata]KAI8599208.1 hypothetical protein EDD21DRAFT_355673 [Dissophora ornata]